MQRFKPEIPKPKSIKSLLIPYIWPNQSWHCSRNYKVWQNHAHTFQGIASSFPAFEINLKRKGLRKINIASILLFHYHLVFKLLLISQNFSQNQKIASIMKTVIFAVEIFIKGAKTHDSCSWKHCKGWRRLLWASFPCIYQFRGLSSSFSAAFQHNLV